MTNDFHNPSGPAPFSMTYEQRLAIEDRLVEVFSEVIDLDSADSDLPLWSASTSQLMELAWTLSRLHRIIDHDTRRPMTMRRIATLLCRNLHRRLPANISSVVRQRQQSGRPSVIDHFGQLWYLHGQDPKTCILWQKPLRTPRTSKTHNTSNTPVNLTSDHHD